MHVVWCTVCTYVCMYVCMHECTYIRTSVWTHTYAWLCSYINAGNDCKHVHILPDVPLQKHTFVCSYVIVCMYVRTYENIYILLRRDDIYTFSCAKVSVFCSRCWCSSLTSPSRSVTLLWRSSLPFIANLLFSTCSSCTLPSRVTVSHCSWTVQETPGERYWCQCSVTH